MATQKRKTILLVEDDTIQSMAGVERLKIFGYGVIVANTGEKAVELAVSDETIDLILMDIMLGGGIDGTEAARRILARRDVPIVFLSSHTDRGIIEKIRSITRYGYVLKNADEFVLFSSIEMAFELFDAKKQLEIELSERKQVEKVLHESEERFQSLFDQAPLGYQSLDIDGNFLEVNEQWLSTLGYTRGDVIGKWFGDFLTPAYQDGFRERFPIFKAKGRIHSEFEMVHKNGSILFIAFDGRIGYALNGDFKKTHCILQDITERKKAEEALRESEERYRNLLDVAPVAIAIQSEGRIVYTNPAGLRLLGAESYDRLIGKPLTEIIHSEGYERSRDRIRRLFSGEEGIYPAEDVYVRLDGRPINVEVMATMLTFNDKPAAQVIVTDITERKQAERSLQYERNLLRILIDNIPDAIYTKDLECRKTLVNAAELHNLGAKTEADILGKNDFDLYPKELAEKFYTDDQVVLHTGKPVVNREEYILDADKRVRWLLTSKFPLRNKDNQIIGLVGIGRDITDRKHAEFTLLESESLFRQLWGATVEGIVIHDGGTILEINDAMCTMFGVVRDEVVGRSLLSFVPPEVRDSFRQHLASGSVGHFEFPARRSDGTTLISEAFVKKIDYKGKSVKMVAVRDVTERKHAAQLLAEEKERLSVTLRSIGDGVITTDIHGRIVLLNKVAEEMTGWKLEDAVGRSLQDVFIIRNELTREACENPVEKVLNTGSIVELANHTCLIAKDGHEIQIADSGAPIRDTNSLIIGVVLVFRDMTEKQKLNDSIQRAQKLESLGILAGGIAHDFNNLLAGIFGYLDMALAGAAANRTDQIIKHLNKALGVYDRAKGLTQQLLTFSKGGTPIRKTIQVAPLVRHSATFAISGSNVNCHFDLAEDLWLCECDENQIGQVIDNIVINGKQAMPMGGKILITALNVSDQPGRPGNFVRISIQDHGVGMPKEIIPKIFDPFFSTKTTGHGLGLATVYSIVQRHGGWIDVESNPGKGSTFHIYLPSSQKKEPAGMPLDEVKHTGTGTILVMDDEEFMLEIVGGMLQHMGYTVVLAKDGQEALTLFADAERAGQPYTASILDLTIPGGAGGKETSIAMRRINPDSIIIASSGYSEDPVISNPVENGFSDSIIKPYRKKELTQLMMRMMRK